jgi:hypothetical protein
MRCKLSGAPFSSPALSAMEGMLINVEKKRGKEKWLWNRLLFSCEELLTV